MHLDAFNVALSVVALSVQRLLAPVAALSWSAMTHCPHGHRALLAAESTSAR